MLRGAQAKSAGIWHPFWAPNVPVRSSETPIHYRKTLRRVPVAPKRGRKDQRFFPEHMRVRSRATSSTHDFEHLHPSHAPPRAFLIESGRLLMKFTGFFRNICPHVTQVPACSIIRSWFLVLSSYASQLLSSSKTIRLVSSASLAASRAAAAAVAAFCCSCKRSSLWCSYLCPWHGND